MFSTGAVPVKDFLGCKVTTAKANWYNKREKGQTIDVSDSRYARRQFIFNQPRIDYQIFLRDADSGSSDDDVYLGSREGLYLNLTACTGGQVVQFRNPQI
jgi:hypothetical protein